MKVTRELAEKVRDVVSAGLVRGKGEPIPGRMCVEAAVCYAMGLPHSDEPTCVGQAVRSFKIALNDSNWSSDMARANGMKRIAIAQLGSIEIDQNQFAKELALATIRQILPIALRAAAKLHHEQKHIDALNDSATACETCDDAAAYAAANAANAAAYAAARSAANAANAAARSAANAANAAARSAANAAARVAAYAAAYAAARDEVLSLMAEIGVEALQKCGSPGCEFLDVIQ